VTRRTGRCWLFGSCIQLIVHSVTRALETYLGDLTGNSGNCSKRDRCFPGNRTGICTMRKEGGKNSRFWVAISLQAMCASRNPLCDWEFVCSIEVGRNKPISNYFWCSFIYFLGSNCWFGGPRGACVVVYRVPDLGALLHEK
jgi:hypothetical protein